MATRRRPMAEINVVPYIDVMLVLLVIFMVAAPLIAQGILIDLPKAPSEQLEQTQDDPLIISIREDGALFLNVEVPRGEEMGERVSADGLRDRVEKVTQVRPDVPVFLGADKSITYEQLAETMTILQRAGAESIGLMTAPPET